MNAKWAGQLMSGNPIIDFQHRLALLMLKKLIVAIKSGECEDTFRESLLFFQCYCIEHFGDEEKILKEHHFPKLEDHIKEHKVMTDEVNKFRDRLNDEGYSNNLAVESLAWLSSWLKRHFDKDDREIILFLRKLSHSKASLKKLASIN